MKKTEITIYKVDWEIWSWYALFVLFGATALSVALGLLYRNYFFVKRADLANAFMYGLFVGLFLVIYAFWVVVSKREFKEIVKAYKIPAKEVKRK